MSPAAVTLPLLFGALTAVAQLVLVREILVVLDGNELSLALALAAWLAGVSLGASAGAALADRLRRPADLACWSAAATALLAPAAVVFVRLSPSLLGLEAGEVVDAGGALRLCLVALAPVSLGSGLSFAPLARDLGAAPGGTGSVSGHAPGAAWVFALEAAGAAVGGLTVSVVLAGRVPHLATAVAAGALAAGAAVWLAVLRRAAVAAVAAGVVAAGLTVALGAGAVAAAEQVSAAARWRALAPGAGELVASAETPYQRLDLTETDGQLDLYSNGAPLLSFPDPWDRTLPIHLAVAELGRQPRGVLLLGGGVADRLAAILEYEPERVDSVELDPAELEIVRRFLPIEDRRALADPRVRVVHADGRRFLSAAEPARYDLVVLEAPDPVTARANRYYTRELLVACARVLAPRGVLATRIGGAVNALGLEAGAPAASLLAGLRDVFGHVAVWPGSTVRMHASREPGVVTEDREALAARLAAAELPAGGRGRGRVLSLPSPEEVAEARAALERLESLPNTDSRPVAYLYALALWEQQSAGGGRRSALWDLRQVRLWWLLVPILLAAAVGLVAPRRRCSLARDGLVVAATSGIAGLGLEVVLLLAFQNVAGSIYQSLGALIGLFMAGMSGATLLAARLVRRLDTVGARRGAAGVDVAVLALALSVPLLPRLGELSPWAAGLGLLLAGALAGASFPFAVALLEAGLGAGRVGRAAGLADAADHLGAMLGALAIGLVVLPVTGLLGAGLVLAGLKTVSLARLSRRLA